MRWACRERCTKTADQQELFVRSIVSITGRCQQSYRNPKKY